MPGVRLPPHTDRYLRMAWRDLAIRVLADSGEFPRRAIAELLAIDPTTVRNALARAKAAPPENPHPDCPAAIRDDPDA